MHLHEYQAKSIFLSYGIPVPAFSVVSNVAEAERALQSPDLQEAFVKIQVHAGGRGKAGGVKFASGRADILNAVKALLGMKMVNEQTGPEGVTANRVILSAPVPIDREYYLGAVIDRESALPLLIASREGGTEIERLAKTSPDKLLKLPIEPSGEIRPFRLHRLNQLMGWKGETAEEGKKIARAVCRAFIENDASLLEINPLVLSGKNLWALDAKLSIDDNALFRQENLKALEDPSQKTKGEADAEKFNLAYVAMDGSVGCMVNGAGLAMATMDLIEEYGGKAANFLDVGGGASKEKIAEGFTIILKDPKVRVILVNIFGGIMDCAVLAEGMIAAAKQCSLHVPLVVRMEGTNVEQGRDLLQRSDLTLKIADTIGEAAQEAVVLARRSEWRSW